MAHSDWMDNAPPPPGADFWRSAPGGTNLPDSSADTTENIRRDGKVGINMDPTHGLSIASPTNTAGDSDMRLEDLVSQGGYTATLINTMAIGVDTTGKVRLTNAVSSADTRAADTIPQGYVAPGEYTEFKGTAAIGLTFANGVNAPGAYAGLHTFRKYGTATDFSGGQVRQEAYLDDGRTYYRMSTSGTVWGPWRRQGASRSDLQTRFTSQANTKISAAGEVRWVGFYNIITTGTNSFEPGGYFRIDMPADAFAVPVAGGGTRAVVSAVANSAIDTGGIPLNAWDTLWYKHPVGQNQTFVPANLLIVPYTANTNVIGPFVEPEDWIKIASRDDASVFSLGTGDVVGLCSHTGRGGKITVDSWTAMKQRVMGDGYFFSPGGNTIIPTAFGFTGIIRWIDGGSTPAVNGSGYRDTGPTGKTAGTAVRGLNGAANRAWRLMTAAEKPSWFGGALRSVNPIDPAATTVVDLNDHETLYFVPNIESSTGNEGQWVVAGYSGFVSTPVHWLPVASRQTTGAQSTMQVLLGGIQMALRAGEAQYTSIGGEHFADAIRRKVMHKGVKHCRWTHNGFFAGAATNGLTSNSYGMLISWDDNSAIYGISDGYASWGNQYTYINVPATGYEIPVVTVNSNITRQVTAIGGRRFIPIAPWEALYFIPPAYVGGNGTVNGDFVIGYYNGNHHIPRNAILLAKYEAANALGIGVTTGKNRVLFMDGTYIQPGYTFPASAAVATLYDLAHNSGEWRNITVAGSTPPGGSAPLPAIAGVLSNYAAPWTAQYRNGTLDDDPRGFVEVKGLITLGTNVTDASPNIAFIPGIQVYGQPIYPVQINASAKGDSHPIMGQVRLVNGTIGNQSGFFIQAFGSSFNTAINPQFTLGLNGNGIAAGALQWVSLDTLGRVPCA